MAFNIFEVIDVSSTGDDVPEGQTKNLNNWEALSTELLIGYKRGFTFSWTTQTQITIGEGVHEVNGTIARVISPLSTNAHGLTGTKIIYLYIDYSAIPASGIIASAAFTWSATGPTWSGEKLGWYTSDDLCIGGFYISSNSLVEFEHANNKIIFGDGIEILDDVAIATSFTDVTALKMPNFATRASVFVRWTYVDAAEDLLWRTNGSASSTGSLIASVAAGATIANVNLDVITDSSGVIEMMESGASTNTCYMSQLGYYLPEGM